MLTYRMDSAHGFYQIGLCLPLLVGIFFHHFAQSGSQNLPGAWVEKEKRKRSGKNPHISASISRSESTMGSRS
jgi:hypothetical protein